MDFKSLLPSFFKKEEKTLEKKRRILQFIENNASKTEFINWLNTQHNIVFSEKTSWKDIKDKLLEQGKIKTGDLELYAASLSGDEDLKNLLQNVEEETQKAKKVARKLSYLSTFKKFSISIGGIIILEGIVFLLFGLGEVLQIIDLPIPGDLTIYLTGASFLFGVINIIGGILLSSG